MKYIFKILVKKNVCNNLECAEDKMLLFIYFCTSSKHLKRVLVMSTQV